MQPRGRVGDDNSLCQPQQDLDWEGIRVPGKNGILSIVATLACWGVCVKNDSMEPSQHLEWTTAVADVGWALEEMVRTQPINDDGEEPPAQLAGRKR